MWKGAIRRGDVGEGSWRLDSKGGNMRIFGNLVGAVLVFFGAVWFLQGINKFPGNSFMNGQTQWSVYGCIAFVAGIVVFVLANRKRPAA